jgi:5-formyltetrahydrofolate cyclo-ligase
MEPPFFPLLLKHGTDTKIIKRRSREALRVKERLRRIHSTAMIKKDIRHLYRERRKALTVVQRNKMDDLLLIRFQTIDLPFIRTLLSFWPIEKNAEPNVHLITDWLDFRNPELIIAYPKTDFELHKMHAVIPGEATGFTTTEFGLHEPIGSEHIEAADIDMVLVPLLAVDKAGYRVGYGKGFYDRFLSGCRKDCIKAGFSYFEPVDQIADKGDFDVPLNLCITPQTVYVF